MSKPGTRSRSAVTASRKSRLPPALAQRTLARMTDEKPGRVLEIAEPCPAAWDEMSGSAARRHCDQCKKTVHHLSAMTPAAAAELLAGAAPGGICVRVRCDRDGFVLHDVPPAQRSAPRRLRLLSPMFAAAMAACSAPTDGDSSLMVEGAGFDASAVQRENEPVRALSALADGTGIARVATLAESHAPKATPLVAPTAALPVAAEATQPPVRRAPAVHPQNRTNPSWERDTVHEEWLTEHPGPPVRASHKTTRGEPKPPAKVEEFDCMGFCI